MKFERRSTASVFAGVLLALGMLWSSAPAAARQMVFSTVAVGSDGDFGDGTRISNRNLERYAKLLSLTPDQKDAAKALLDGYLAESRAAAKEMQSAMESAFAAYQDSQDNKALRQETSAAQKKHSTRVAELEKGFFDDTRQMLSPEQEQRWPLVERLRRREKGLLNGSLSGESVDLTEVLDGLNLDDSAEAAIADEVEQYEADMDRAIQARDAALASSQVKDTVDDMVFDFAAMQAAMAKAREAGAQVRDVNVAHQRRIEVLLPENRRADFDAAYKSACFPEVYRETQVARTIRAAGSLASLTPEQKASLDELAAGYARQAGPANDAWAAAVAASEAEGKDGAVSMGGSMMRISFGDDTGPVAEARKARREIDNSTKEKLNSILTPAQQEQLPKEQEESVDAIVGGGAVMIRSGG